MSVRLVGAFVIFTLPLFSGKLCGIPGRPVDGFFAPVMTEYQPGTAIQYFCEPRNLIFGSVDRTCQEDGRWSENVPVCGKPTPVKEVFQSSTLGNLTADKAVDGNYKSYSSTGLQEKGYWTAVLENLEAMAAIRITFPAAKGLRLEVLITNGSSNGFSCGMYDGNTGINVTKIFYCPPESIGNTIRIQDYLGDPDSLQLIEVEVFAKKEMSCLLPDIPAKGFGAKKFGKKDTFHYFCAKGYALNGTNIARCYPNATWSPRTPVCEDIHCDPPRTPENGIVNYDSVTGGVPFGGSANYSCNEGYIMQGKAYRKCVGQNSWSGSKPPKCVAIQCGNLSFQILNGRLVYSNVTVNSVAMLQCNDGHRPSVNDRLICQPNGRWSHSMLRCEPIRCDNVETVVMHGRVKLLDGSTFYGSRLRIICDSGFRLSGDELRMCGEDGNWGDFNSVCQEIICPQFSMDTEGGHWVKLNATETSLSVGSVFAFECYPGFEFIGDCQLTVCLENGSWSDCNSYCLETIHPDPSVSSKEWSPKTMMMTAMGIGVGSALCILCLVAGIFLFKRKSRYRNSPPVFHVGIGAKPATRDNRGLLCGKTGTIDDHYYSTAAAIYEEVQQRAPPLPKQRKPRSALPPTPPPLDADAVYSQPFEELTDGVSRVPQDDDQAHIYAEPVDTCDMSSECKQNLENQRKDDTIIRDKPMECIGIFQMENSVIYETPGKSIALNLDMISNDIYLETK